MPVWDRRPPKPRPAPPVTPGRDIAVPRPISGPRTLGRQQTVFFAVPKGGTGKTSTSLTFAATLAQALKPFNKSVCWMDGNVQQADGAHYLGATETSRTILDLAGLPVVTDEDMQAILATPAQTGYDMWAVFGPAVKAQANPTVASPELYRMVLQMLRQRFDYVVVDTPVAEHYHRFFTDFVFPCADRLVVVTEPILRTINGVQEWLELIGYPVYAGGHSYNAERVVILLNRAVENINCDEELVRDQLLCKWTWGGSIQLDTDWMKAINQGELPLDNPGVVEALANLATLVTGEAMPVAAGKVGKARVKARGHKRPAKGGFLHRLVG
jgi:MinD-like ATPase involved in chromosome partitioning or flagellar assembly